MQPEIIAHRGASYLAPENTLAAFHLARELGADGVEFDVQETKDRQLVIHHDYVTDFHTQLSGNIYDMLEGDLRKLDFGSWKNVDFFNEKIPTLDEALEASREFDTIMVELKSNVYPDSNFVANVVERIQAAGLQDKAILLAFQHDLLAQARQIAPGIRVCALLYGALEGFFYPSPAVLEDLGLTNSLEDEATSDLLALLSGPNALGTALDISENPELYSEENSTLSRWIDNQITMLKASFPGQNMISILFNLAAQRDPAAYIKKLSFTPDYVSCEYHTAYAHPTVVDELHELGVKVAFWTPDTKNAIRSLLPLGPDFIVTNRPDAVREWMEEEGC